MDEQEKKLLILKQLYWDYDFDPQSVLSVLEGEKDSYYHLNKEKIFIRMLEHLSWYDILSVISLEKVKDILTPQVIASLRSVILKRRYERLYKFLHDEALPNDGWDPEYIKSIRTTVLSDRWYGALQRIL